MNIFGIGTMEFAVIIILALIVFGPGRLPEIMGEAGRMLRELRRQTRDITGDFEESIRDVRTTVTDVRGEMRSTMQDFQRETSSISSSISDSVNDATAAANSGIQDSSTSAQRRASSVQQAAAGEDQVVSVTVDPNAARAHQPEAVKPSKDDPLADLAEIDDDLLNPSRS